MSLSLDALKGFKVERDISFIPLLDECIKEAYLNFRDYVIIPSNLQHLLEGIEEHYISKGFKVYFDTCVLDYIITGWGGE